MDERVLIAGDPCRKIRKRKWMIYADIIVDISHEKLDRDFQYLCSGETEAKRYNSEWWLPLPFGRGNTLSKGICDRDFANG
ncbi:MAG: hypothetical protein ACLUVM_08645 [Blautia faecis]